MLMIALSHFPFMVKATAIITMKRLPVISSILILMGFFFPQASYPFTVVVYTWPPIPWNLSFSFFVFLPLISIILSLYRFFLCDLLILLIALKSPCSCNCQTSIYSSSCSCGLYTFFLTASSKCYMCPKLSIVSFPNLLLLKPSLCT